ncbi:MAG TPA: hypothetical protein VGR20_05870 [Acidimicrobiia bacterium]|nr:hypothetical protein [Acidimicrobiia bacterium]
MCCPRFPRALAAFAVPGLLLLLLGGCRVDATVEVKVSEAAGGVVTARLVLDREAAAVLGGAVGDGVRTSDLERAGWEMTPFRPTAGGGVEAGISKAFHRPGDFGLVMGELSGPGGPFRGFSLERHRSLLKETYRLRGTADVGPEALAATGFANTPDLTARLRDAGVDPGRVEALLAGRAADGLHLRLVAAVPGRRQAWAVAPGSPQTVDVSSSVSDRRRPALLAVAVLSGLAVVVRLRRRTPQS